MSRDSAFWLDRLVQATAFHKVERPSQAYSREDGEPQPWHPVIVEAERVDPAQNIDWKTQRFVSVTSINEVIEQVVAAAEAANTYVNNSVIFDQMAAGVTLSDRAAHLEALSQVRTRRVTDGDLAQALVQRIEAWQESPSVTHWCEERLLGVVVDRLPGLTEGLIYGYSRIPGLLKRSDAPDHQIFAALLEAIERHVDVLSAPTIFALVGLLAGYCPPEDAAMVIARYVERLVQRIPALEQDHWDLVDMPTDAADGIARLLYALMSDVDVQNRWRAAHALRCLTRLGDTAVLDRMVELYNRTSEPCYRQPDIPFYWLAARLWLLITLDRIAAEMPAAVQQHGPWLLDIASDQEFPHVLVQSFAKSAVWNLVESGKLALDATQQDCLKRVNTSPFPRKNVKQRFDVGFDRYGYLADEDRRFHFDGMNTLPYWYTRALRAFADVSQEEFLDTAERWIVDRWDVQDSAWQWDAEPRKHREDRRSSMSMGNDHGSLPILERFHTYLEWHAMWCATGELLQTRALARAKEDDYYSLEGWLSGNGLTAPPLWLADLHDMKPLEDRFWFAPPSDVTTWIDNLSDEDFLIELGLMNDDEMLVVGSHYDVQSSAFKLSARVITALVSPDTAGALVRALQTVNDAWDYGIPSAGDESEIHAPPYTLVGWLVDTHHDLAMDEHDPFRYGVRPIERRPSEKTARWLNLVFMHDDQTKWVNTERNPAMIYEAWGDTRGDEREEHLRYDTDIRSSGWRLRIDRRALQAFLKKKKLDLIVEVEITRRNPGYEEWRRQEEKTEEARYDRVLLLRRDGTIEGTEGRLGTWTSSGT